MDGAEEMSDRRGFFFLEMHCNAGRRKEINGKERRPLRRLKDQCFAGHAQSSSWIAE